MKTIVNMYYNIGASILPQIVNIVSSFILPVLIINIYGSQINGLTATIKSLVGYISLVGAGIATVTTQSLYGPVARQDAPTVRGMLCAAANMFNRCGYMYVIIVLVVSFIYPFLIKENVSYTTTVLLLVVMSISGASEFFVVGRCRSLLYADRKVYVSTGIQSLSLIIGLILAIIMLKFETNIVLVQLGISGVYIARALLLALYVRKRYPQYVCRKDTKPIMNAVKKRKDAMIHQLSGLIVFGSQSIILSVMVSLEAASIYAVYNIIFSGLYSICSNINVAISPFLGKTLAVGTMEKVKREFNIMEYSFYILTTVILTVTILTILSFISLYTKNADINYIYPRYALMFVIIQVFNMYRLPNIAIINVAGHFKETRFRAIIESMICLVASVIFTFFWGMYGVLVGTGIAIGWRCFDMIWYTYKYILEDSVLTSLFRLTRTLSIIVLFYFVVKNPFLSIDSYFDWMLYVVAILFIVSSLLAIDALLFERKSLNDIMKIVLKK